MKKSIIIVSMNGEKPVGGVERVVYYLHQILNETQYVKIFQAQKSNNAKFNLLLGPLLMSLKLLFTSNKIVISQSAQSCFYKNDFVIMHGTWKGFIVNNPTLATFGQKIIAIQESIAAKRAKFIFAVSEKCKEELIELCGIQPEKIKVLNNFVNENEFFPNTKSRSKFDELIILYSGALTMRKGVDRLLLLAKYIDSYCDNVKLKIATYSDINLLPFKNLKNVEIYKGLKFSEMCDYYNQGDVLYFPSNYEGFSMATLEALSCGIPVIGSEYAVMKEVQKYDFTKVINDYNPEHVIQYAKILKGNFSVRRDEIHSTIAKDFGYEQYKEKLLSYMQSVL